MAEVSLEAPRIIARAGADLDVRLDTRAARRSWPCTPVEAATEGMDEEAALQAITIDAATISGIADRVGSLECGKDADIIVLSGHPFDLMTKVEQVFIDGDHVYTADGRRRRAASLSFSS